MKNEIILYCPDELSKHIEVQIDEETVWLNLNKASNSRHIYDRKMWLKTKKVLLICL
jgi:hypothetical protein